MKSKLFKFLSSVFVLFAVTLMSCGQIADSPKVSGNNGGGVEVKVNLPSLKNASIRALTPAEKEELMAITSSYRVTFVGGGQTIERTGTGTVYSATYPIGTVVSVTIECLNSAGQVVLRTIPKSVTVRSGSNNNLSFTLSEDGTKITPEPEPVPEPTEITVTFVLGDGGSWTESTVMTGESVTIPHAVPTHSGGKSFAGWHDDDGNVHAAGAVITVSMTLTAKWSDIPTHKVTYDLGFDPASGTRTEETYVEEGQEVPLDAPSVTRPGYEFVQWQDATGAPVTSLTMSTQDITLSASWNAIEYDITYDVNNGQGAFAGGATKFRITDASVTMPTSVPTRAKFDYVGVASENDAEEDEVLNNPSGEALFELMTQDNPAATTLTLYAVWKPMETQYVLWNNITSEGGTTSVTKGIQAFASVSSASKISSSIVSTAINSIVDFCFDDDKNLYVVLEDDQYDRKVYKCAWNGNAYSTATEFFNITQKNPDGIGVSISCDGGKIYLLWQAYDYKLTVFNSDGSEDSFKEQLTDINACTIYDIAVKGNTVCYAYQYVDPTTYDNKYAVNSTTLGATSWDDSGAGVDISLSEIDNSIQYVNAIDYDYKVTDMQIVDSTLYALVDLRSDYVDVSPSNKGYSTGGVIRINISSNLTMREWTGTKALGWANGGIPTSDSDPAHFYGAAHFVAIKPEQLVIADDGCYYESDYATQKNRVVTVDLETATLSSAVDVGTTFNGYGDANQSYYLWEIN